MTNSFRRDAALARLHSPIEPLDFEPLRAVAEYLSQLGSEKVALRTHAHSCPARALESFSRTATTCSRNTNFWTFPDVVSGNDSTNIT
jgi:hypothetical protein